MRLFRCSSTITTRIGRLCGGSGLTDGGESSKKATSVSVPSTSWPTSMSNIGKRDLQAQFWSSISSAGGHGPDCWLANTKIGPEQSQPGRPSLGLTRTPDSALGPASPLPCQIEELYTRSALEGLLLAPVRAELGRRQKLGDESDAVSAISSALATSRLKSLSSGVAKPLDWDDLLVKGYEPLKVAQRVFRRLPHDPRCKLCQNPFGGVGGKMVGLLGAQALQEDPPSSKWLRRLPGSSKSERPHAMPRA
jgi:hypothetical protein